MAVESWLTDGDDETLTVNRKQLRDFIARGTFGTVEKEYVHSACLRLFTKRFASQSMSWAGAKGNKEFTLKNSAMWELLNDVISAKFQNFMKNMGVIFNNFHKDVGKEATRAGENGRIARGDRHSGDHVDEDVLPQNPDELFEGGVEDGDGQATQATYQEMLSNSTS